MRGIVLIGVLIAMAVIAYLQLNAMDGVTGGANQAPGEAAKHQAEEIERELKQAAEKHKRMLEEAQP